MSEMRRRLIVKKTSDKYIRFKDPVVAKICAEKWGDGVGLTLEQAAAVTDIGTTFQGNTEITSFTELPMFDINKISERAFYNCTNLFELTLFEGITKIEQRALAFAPIKELYIPSSLSYVSGMHAFTGVKLDTLVVGDMDSWLKIAVDGVGDSYNMPNVNSSNIVVIGKEEYFDYVVPSDIDEIPDRRLYKFPIRYLDSGNVKTISNGAMQNSAIERVVLNSVDTIESSAFQSCESLVSIRGFENVISLGDRAFVYCSNLSNAIQINPSILQIKEYTFYGCNKVPYFDFRSHEQVPSLLNVNGISKSKILVPDELYDQWIVATNWAFLKNQIVKASEFVEPNE